MKTHVRMKFQQKSMIVQQKIEIRNQKSNVFHIAPKSLISPKIGPQKTEINLRNQTRLVFDSKGGEIEHGFLQQNRTLNGFIDEIEQQNMRNRTWFLTAKSNASWFHRRNRTTMK